MSPDTGSILLQGFLSDPTGLKLFTVVKQIPKVNATTCLSLLLTSLGLDWWKLMTGSLKILFLWEPRSSKLFRNSSFILFMLWLEEKEVKNILKNTHTHTHPNISWKSFLVCAALSPHFILYISCMLHQIISCGRQRFQPCWLRNSCHRVV